MSEETYFKFSNKVLLVPMIAVLLIWTVFWIEVRFQVNLNQYGIFPRNLKGLRGVLFSPFLHGSIEHLYNNTIPLAILTASLVYFYRSIRLPCARTDERLFAGMEYRCRLRQNGS